MTSSTAHKSEAIDSKRGWGKRFRALGVGILIGIGCLSLSVYVVVHWVERQVFTTDNWVTLVSPLPKQPVVSGALGNLISDQVFSAVSVQQKIADSLPPKAAFLAPPLSDQLKTITTKFASKLVASDAFQTIWSGANRHAMNRLVSTARNEGSPVQTKVNQKFDINISDISDDLRKALGRASDAIPALEPASKKTIGISTDLKARPHRLHQVVRTTDTLAAVLPLLVVTCFITALAFSRRRRHTVFVVAITVIILMLAELVAVKWLREQTLNQVNNPANLSAVGYVYDTLVGWLRHMIFWVIAAATVCVGGVLLGGPTEWAVSARKLVRLDRVHNSSLMIKWRQARLSAAQWKGYLWLGSAVLVLVSLVTFASVNGQSILNASLLVISLCALVQIIASPPTKILPNRE